MYSYVIHSYENMWIALVVWCVSLRVMLRVMKEFFYQTNHNNS